MRSGNVEKPRRAPATSRRSKITCLDDANMDVIRARLKTYERETKPVLNYYGRKAVHLINTDGTPPQTFSKILRHVVRLR